MFQNQGCRICSMHIVLLALQLMIQVMMLGDKCSMPKNVLNGIKGYIYDIPTMQFLTGIPRNTHISQNLICYHWLNVSGIS